MFSVKSIIKNLYSAHLESLLRGAFDPGQTHIKRHFYCLALSLLVIPNWVAQNRQGFPIRRATDRRCSRWMVSLRSIASAKSCFPVHGQLKWLGVPASCGFDCSRNVIVWLRDSSMSACLITICFSSFRTCFWRCYMPIWCRECIRFREIPCQATLCGSTYNGDSGKPFAVKSREAIRPSDGHYFGSTESPRNHVIVMVLLSHSICICGVHITQFPTGCRLLFLTPPLTFVILPLW